MRRHVSPASVLSLYLETMTLCVEAQMVIALRMMRFMSGGAIAQREAGRAVTEKVAVAAAGAAATAGSLAIGHGGDRIARATVRRYRTRVRANRRRLTR